MKTCVSKALVVLMLVASVMLEACESNAGGPHVVLHGTGGDVTVPVEIADTQAERSLGLMYRKDLAANAGMLFLFEETSVHGFWMKNTPLPLDMLFIDEQLTIVGIVADAEPYTTVARSVGVPSRYVLEVHAGFSARHGVRAGDRVSFVHVPGFAPAP
jgi:uncharacterized membrane protein (UPF0127 family)